MAQDRRPIFSEGLLAAIPWWKGKRHMWDERQTHFDFFEKISVLPRLALNSLSSCLILICSRTHFYTNCLVITNLLPSVHVNKNINPVPRAEPSHHTVAWGIKFLIHEFSTRKYEPYQFLCLKYSLFLPYLINPTPLSDLSAFSWSRKQRMIL